MAIGSEALEPPPQSRCIPTHLGIPSLIKRQEFFDSEPISYSLLEERALSLSIHPRLSIQSFRHGLLDRLTDHLTKKDMLPRPVEDNGRFFIADCDEAICSRSRRQSFRIATRSHQFL